MRKQLQPSDALADSLCGVHLHAAKADASYSDMRNSMHSLILTKLKNGTSIVWIFCEKNQKYSERSNVCYF